MDTQVHSIRIDENGVTDPETLELCRDFVAVDNALFQSMPIIGPWFETRIKLMLRRWLVGYDLQISGPTQIFSLSYPELRSRSWDVVIHRKPAMLLPPAASPEAGFPLIPAPDVIAAIDTKTNFSDPAAYARQTAFNLMNDAAVLQTELIGGSVEKMLLTISSSRSPDAMVSAGFAAGIKTFSLGRYVAGPVSHGKDRVIVRRLEQHSDGAIPLQKFKLAVTSAAERYTSES